MEASYVGKPDAQGAQRAGISPSIAEALSKDHEPTQSIMEALASLDMRSCGMSMTIVEALERDEEPTPSLPARFSTDSPRGTGISMRIPEALYRLPEQVQPLVGSFAGQNILSGGISASIAKALENDHGPTPSLPGGFNNLSLKKPWYVDICLRCTQSEPRDASVTHGELHRTVLTKRGYIGIHSRGAG
ncbi:hypothetical protein FALBO_1561 [Fusarium albosuccineum]|uniref:Uncharacterized protein n=1 Tax=Fusarium albosuccineum TaxID=1237068 RepID=A0A8H4LLE6_9HYPO|nr:hypothetical protein FALBO_1561 [Fusarium albosuccineum]